MTFQPANWSIDGNPRNGNDERVMLYHATEGNQGVLGPLDLIVSATGPNSQGVSIGPGSCVVLGGEFAFQGSYHGYNVGADLSLATFTATGASPRSDMVIAEAQDPTWSGSPWGVSASGPCVVPAILSGVSSTATQPTPGISAIPLARVDIPAFTSIITPSMITDLRAVSNPNRFRSVLDLQAFWSSPSVSPVSATVVQWPLNATWQINVPSWATFAIMHWAIFGAQANTGSNPATCMFYPVIGSSVTSPVVAFGAADADAPAGVSNSSRLSFGGADMEAIPASIRGTTQTLQFAAFGAAGGTLTMDTHSGLLIDYEFLGLASLA